MTLEQIVEKHLLNYNRAELDSLVSSERTTYEELAVTIKKDMERIYQSDLQSIMTGKDIKEVVSIALSMEPLILARISK